MEFIIPAFVCSECNAWNGDGDNLYIMSLIRFNYHFKTIVERLHFSFIFQGKS